MVVRHPLDRLVSAYTDKIRRNYLNFQSRIEKHQRKTGNKHISDFGAFLEFIIAHRKKFDQHWLPEVGICDPCHVKYDRILKLETQTEDLLAVLPRLGPHRRGYNVHSFYRGRGAINNFSRSLPEFLDFDGERFQELLSLGYQADLDLFGYTWSNTSDDAGFQVHCSDPKLKCC